LPAQVFTRWQLPLNSPKSRQRKMETCPLVTEKMSSTPDTKVLTDTPQEESDDFFWEHYSTDHRTFINHYLNEDF
jgi:hypothetical protein